MRTINPKINYLHRGSNTPPDPIMQCVILTRYTRGLFNELTNLLCYLPAMDSHVTFPYKLAINATWRFFRSCFQPPSRLFNGIGLLEAFHITTSHSNLAWKAQMVHQAPAAGPEWSTLRKHAWLFLVLVLSLGLTFQVLECQSSA